MLKRTIVTLIILLMAVPFASAREFEETEMPEKLTIADQTLALNGGGVRKVMFMKPYIAGLYLKEAETDAQEIMMADEVMVIRLELISGTSRTLFLRAFKNGMRSAAGSLDMSWDTLEDRYDKFVELLSGDIEEGDLFEFVYLPDEGLQVIKNNEHLGTIEGLDFKQAYYGIWLNDESPADENLKAGMIEGDMRIDMAEIREEEERKLAEAEAAEEARREAEEKAEAEAAAEEEAMRKAEEEEARAKAEAEAKAEEAEAEMAESDTISQDQFVSKAIYFGFDDDSLSADAEKRLDEKVEFLKANADVSVVLEAAADEQGPAVYNEWLAQKRGAAVKNYLEDAGIDSDRIEVDVIGEISKDNYAESRRVQFRIK